MLAKVCVAVLTCAHRLQLSLLTRCLRIFELIQSAFAEFPDNSQE